MRRAFVYSLCLMILGLSSVHRAAAQTNSTNKPSSTASAAAAPTSGFRAEFLQELAYYEQRYTRLAEGMPAEKYAWRPGEGVRSVGEVYAHIVGANYGAARALGTPPPPGFDFRSVMALSNEKAKLLQALKDSFGHMKQAVVALNDADADKPQSMFGQKTTLRGSLVVVTGHFGEHLGQSIAYARMNGVVPPWTEESQRQQQKPTDKPKQ